MEPYDEGFSDGSRDDWDNPYDPGTDDYYDYETGYEDGLDLEMRKLTGLEQENIENEGYLARMSAAPRTQETQVNPYQKYTPRWSAFRSGWDSAGYDLKEATMSTEEYAGLEDIEELEANYDEDDF